MTVATIDHFAVPAELAHLESLEDRVVALLDRWSDIRDRAQVRFNIMLALQEICVNIVEHAYGDVPGQIEVTVYAGSSPARIEIVLHDTGGRFDPLAVRPPSLGEPDEGGLGLFLAEALMDSVTYSAEAGHNQWHLVKLLEPATLSPAAPTHTVEP